MENITLAIIGMSCTTCLRVIVEGVRSVAGVERVTVSLGEGSVQISYDPLLTSLDTVRNTIEELGYRVGTRLSCGEIHHRRERQLWTVYRRTGQEAERIDRHLTPFSL